MRIYKVYFLIIITILVSCKTREEKSIGTIERLDEELNSIISEEAKVEIIAEGFEWAEGPVWNEQYKMLLFSDVPKNTIYKWTENKGLETYLTPSGFTGKTTYSKEPGSNGLVINKDGKLILCQHGDRRIAMMDADIDAPKPIFISIADHYEGMRFNSPNDAVYRSNGDIFFTDPPYGLPNQENDSTKETPYHGVYKTSVNGKTSLVTDSLTRPNGITFLNDKTFIVANSDPDKAIWYAYGIDANDSVTNARIFYDATALTKTEKGLPDGLKVDSQGNIFATGPGGIWIFNKAGNLIGKIKITELASNCNLSQDGKTLYVTADMYVLRIKLR